MSTDATAELLEKARAAKKLQPTDEQRNAALLAAMAKPIHNHHRRSSDAASNVLASPIVALDVHDLAKRKFKPREPLLEPWLHSQDLTMVYAARGVGKTHFGLAISYAIATCGGFLDWNATQARKVLYLDGELPGTVMQNRLLMHLPKQEPAPGFLRIFTPDLLGIDDVMPDLSTPDGQITINGMIEPDTAVVIVDNLSAWARGSRAENDAESWLPIAAWALDLRRRGICVVMIHHAGKGGDQRGTSKKEDLLDVVIKLCRPKDYTPEQGARFEVHFTKARHLHGNAAEARELTLTTDSEGVAIWQWQTLEGSTYQRVVELSKEGLSQAEIGRELEINRSNVSRHYRKAVESGDLKK